MKKKVVIIGAGAAGIFLANQIDTTNYQVEVFEKNANAGRKFLVAGYGGLNLTHSEPEDLFIERYTPQQFLASAFSQFNNVFFCNWLNRLGIPTRIGSSGRVFPLKGVKPATILNELVSLAKQRGVVFNFLYEWKEVSTNDELVFLHKGQQIAVKADIVVFCLGGASWSVTGSKGDWFSQFIRKGITVAKFQASNCRMLVEWPEDIKYILAGKPLKNLRISCGTAQLLGELVITENGLEGSGIYPLSPQIRQSIQQTGSATLTIDLKPALSEEQILKRLQAPHKLKTRTEHIKQALHLDKTAFLVFKHSSKKETLLNEFEIAKAIKSVTINITGLGDMEDAISTVGGIQLNELSADFELKQWPKHYCIGEMLNYDAPTGGYLLQSCFTMAMQVAKTLNNGK